MRYNVFKKIVAIVCILSVFCIPATALAASNPTPICSTYTESLKVFAYSPTPYSITPGSYLTLEDTVTGGPWYVPANKSFRFGCGLTSKVTFTYAVYNSSNQVIQTQTIASSSFSFNIPPSSSGEFYFVRVFAVSNLPVSVVSYWAAYN